MARKIIYIYLLTSILLSGKLLGATTKIPCFYTNIQYGDQLKGSVAYSTQYDPASTNIIELSSNYGFLKCDDSYGSPNTQRYIYYFNFDIYYGTGINKVDGYGISMAYAKHIDRLAFDGWYTTDTDIVIQRPSYIGPDFYLSTQSNLVKVTNGQNILPNNRNCITNIPYSSLNCLIFTNTTLIQTNIIMYAIYRNSQADKQYTVYFNPGDFSSSGLERSITREETGSFIELWGAIFSRSGYSMSGWSIFSDGRTYDYELDSTFYPRDTTTLYPYWTPNTYSITINPNGGSFGSQSWVDQNGNATNYTQFMSSSLSDASSIIQNLNSPDGMTFAGFWTDPTSGFLAYTPSGMAVSGEVFSATSSSNAKWISLQDITLYAHWYSSSMKNKIHLHGYQFPSHYIPYKAGIYIK